MAILFTTFTVTVVFVSTRDDPSGQIRALMLMSPIVDAFGEGEYTRITGTSMEMLVQQANPLFPSRLFLRPLPCN